MFDKNFFSRLRHRLLRRKSGQTPRRRKTQGNADQDTTDTCGRREASPLGHML